MLGPETEKTEFNMGLLMLTETHLIRYINKACTIESGLKNRFPNGVASFP